MRVSPSRVASPPTCERAAERIASVDASAISACCSSCLETRPAGSSARALARFARASATAASAWAAELRAAES